MSATSRGRGRGRGRGMRGMMMGFNPYMGGYVAMMPIRGRGRGFRYEIISLIYKHFNVFNFSGRAKTNWYAPY